MPLILSGTNLAKPITDATASPSDVSSGKIFYNNDGKQVGTGSTISTTIISSSSEYIGTISPFFSQTNKSGAMTADYLLLTNNGAGITSATFASSASSNYSRKYYGTIDLSNKYIVGIKCDNTMNTVGFFVNPSSPEATYNKPGRICFGDNVSSIYGILYRTTFYLTRSNVVYTIYTI